MKQINGILRSRSLFFLALSGLLACGSIYLLVFGKAGSFTSLNSFHPFWLNVFFINYTFMGDGIFAIALVMLYLFYFKKKQQAIALLYAFLLSGIIVQIIKNLADFPHPKLFFENGQYLFFINDVSLSDHNSFPSGHTATAFALVTVLMFVVKNSKWQLPLLFAALLIGYSRIYLAQHFLVDVLIAAVLGTVSGIAAVYLAYYFKGYGYYLIWFQKFKKFKRVGLTS